MADGIWLEEPCKAPLHIRDYAARFDHLLYLTQQPDRWSRARAINLLEAFLLEIAEDRARQPAVAPAPLTEPWLASLLSLLNETADAEDGAADYSDFARQWSVSLSTLRRRFRAATGVPLHEYAIQGRIARARSLLGETDLPVKAVAEKLGYRDVYFFTRQFRQSVGVPPAAYRRSRQG
jgi:transcriptional regulator GlxA family with amidase domain